MACLFCGGDDAPDHFRVCPGIVPLHARTSDPDTSHEAMETYDQGRMRSAVQVVVQLFRDRGPMSDYQLRDAFAQAWMTPCDDSLHRQARSVARDKGLIRDTGERSVNPTTGRRQVVWGACHDEAPQLQRCHSCGHILRRQAATTSKGA